MVIKMKNTETLTKPQANLLNEAGDQNVADIVDVKEMLNDPELGNKISQEFEALWDVYEGRRIGNTMQYGKTTIEDSVIATRYFDEVEQGHAVEETYWRTDLYGPNQHNGKTEMLFINITSPGASEFQISVGEDHNVKVLSRNEESGEWSQANADDAERVVSEFFHRTLIAADIHSQRTPEEKTAADEDARQLVLNKYPILGNKKTSEE